MSRIEINDTLEHNMFKISEGNPGAIAVIIALMKVSPDIDPQCAFGELGPLLSLDTFHIYGSHIWMLFKDKCKQNCRTMLMLLRATQLGLFSSSRLRTLEDVLTEEELNDLDNKVCARLEQFKRKE